MFDRSTTLIGTAWVLGAVGVFTVLSCSDSTADFGEPLSITLTVDRSSGTAGVDLFTFRYDASGSQLLGVVLEFGDGQADSVAGQGGSTARATRTHLYEIPGTYSANARVVEALGATLADTVVVQIQ